jgi:predicted cupin superfamily sugar epimerase
VDVTQWIAELGLSPHPEGGWFRETFRSKEIIATARGPRSAGTMILYALPARGFSAWHRVTSDELWTWHGGEPATVYQVLDGRLVATILGPPGQGRPQMLVPGGVWQATEASSQGPTLFGCAVIPGFSFDDFSFGDDVEILEVLPEFKEAARRFVQVTSQ